MVDSAAIWDIPEDPKSEPSLFEGDQPWLLSKSPGLETKDLIVGESATSVFLPQYDTRAPMLPAERQALSKHFMEAPNIMRVGPTGYNEEISNLIKENNDMIQNIALIAKGKTAAVCEVQEKGNPR